MAGQFGDIDWKRLDPKTWELSNRVPSDTPTTTTTSTTLPAAMFDEYQSQPRDYAPAEPSQAAQRHMWRSQLKQFDQTLKKGDPRRRTDDAIQGIQELVDSGAIWFNEDDGGLYSALPHHPGGKQGTERLLEASRLWADRQDQIIQQYGTSNDPDSTKARMEAMQRAMDQAAPYAQTP
jgi:hypothetical protein